MLSEGEKTGSLIPYNSLPSYNIGKGKRRRRRSLWSQLRRQGKHINTNFFHYYFSAFSAPPHHFQHRIDDLTKSSDQNYSESDKATNSNEILGSESDIPVYGVIPRDDLRSQKVGYVILTEEQYLEKMSPKGPSRLFCSWQFAMLLGMICGTLIYVNIIMTHMKAVETSSKGILERAEQARRIDEQNFKDFDKEGNHPEQDLAPPEESNEEGNEEKSQEKEVEKSEDKEGAKEKERKAEPAQEYEDEPEGHEKAQLWMIQGNGPQGSIFKNDKYPERCKEYNDKFQGQIRADLKFPHVESCPRWSRWLKEIRECILKELPTGTDKMWTNLHETVVCCVSQFRTLLSAMPLFGKDDIKFVVLPMMLTDPCRVVTLGVGNDISVERKLQKAQRQCEFFGADPNYNYTELYEKVGDMHEIAVSGSGGKRKIWKLGPDQKYTQSQSMETVALEHFLDKTIHQNEIDYLFMDIEGSEYSILPEFLKGGSLHPDDSSVVICQLTVELHGPLSKYNMTQEAYKELMERFFDESPYIPIWAPKPSVHQRIFLINGETQYCLDKFFLDWCPENDAKIS